MKRLRQMALCVAMLMLLCCAAPAASAVSTNYSYTVYLEAQGGIGTATQTYATKTLWGSYHVWDLPTPTMQGYTFEGWYDDLVGGTKVTTSYNFTKDTTIYAHWVPDVSAQTQQAAQSETQADSGNLLRDHMGTIIVVTGVTAVVVAVIVAQTAQ